jgi:hypothetical protein
MFTLIRLHPQEVIFLPVFPVLTRALISTFILKKVNKMHNILTRLAPHKKPVGAVVKLYLKALV